MESHQPLAEHSQEYDAQFSGIVTEIEKRLRHTSA